MIFFVFNLMQYDNKRKKMIAYVCAVCYNRYIRKKDN